MTTPSGVAEITGRISSIQSMINSLTSGSMPFAATGNSLQSTATSSAVSTAASPADAAAAFSQALAAASGTTAARGLSSVGTAGTAATAGGTGSAGSTGSAAVAQAESYLGVPYQWGGESRSGIDCSGLVQSSYAAVGVDLPRTAAEQQRVGTPVASLAQAQPGDLLFFGQPAHHVAIYLGDNKLIEAPQEGQTVSIRDVYQTPTSISRVAPTGALAGTATAAGTTGAVGGIIPLGTTATTTSSPLAPGVSASVAAYAPLFSAAETKYQLPAGVLSAVAQQESGGNPRAVSPDGAQGLMQLMPATAAGQGVDAFDPAQAIDAAGRILSRDLTAFGGSVPLALAAYNAGAGAVQQHGGVPPYPETQQYVRAITSRLGIAAA